MEYAFEKSIIWLHGVPFEKKCTRFILPEVLGSRTFERIYFMTEIHKSVALLYQNRTHSGIIFREPERTHNSYWIQKRSFGLVLERTWFEVRGSVLLRRFGGSRFGYEGKTRGSRGSWFGLKVRRTFPNLLSVQFNLN